MNAPWDPLPHSLSGKAVADILQARERLGGMENAKPWPDDYRILAARDRISRIFRLYCHWPNELFLPADSMNALHANWSQDGFDVAEVVMEIEDLFDIEYPEDDAGFWDLTYLEFLERFLGKVTDGFKKYDSEAMQPFTLPEGHHAGGWWKYAKRLVADRFHAQCFRNRQAARGGPWRTLWPDDPATASAREKASAILVDELGWFDDAFVPEDCVDALFLPGKGKRGGILRSVQRLNQAFPGARLTVNEVRQCGRTFAALIERLADCAARYAVPPCGDDGAESTIPSLWQPMNVIEHSERKRVEILRARAESGGGELWRSLWPDDPCILEARDRMSSLVRLHCGWPNEFFIPSDTFFSITTCLDCEPFDLGMLACEVEELFGFTLPAEETWGQEYTYLDFLLTALDEGSPDYEKWDAEAFAPFILRPDYHESWWVRNGIRFGKNCAQGTVGEFHSRQRRRTGKWRSYWPDIAALITARDTVSAILTGELRWPSDAFIPDDRLDALLSGIPIRRLHRAVDAIKAAFPSFVPDAFALSRNSMSYGSFLRCLAGGFKLENERRARDR